MTGLPAPRPPTFNYYGPYVVGQSDGKLLPHQSEALRSLQDWFTNDPTSIALVSMPTGSGKTGVICCLPYFLGSLQSSGSGQYDFLFDKPVLVIAPSLGIADQLEVQILISKDDPDANFIHSRRRIIPDRIPDALAVGVKIEDTKSLRNPGYLEMNNVIIANAQKFLDGAWENALADDIFRLVIVDEAHHFPAPTWRRIIDKFRGHALVVFFTATPFRTDKQLVVADDRFAYHLSLKDARYQGIIRRTNFLSVPDFGMISQETPVEEIFMPILRKVRAMREKKDRDTPLPDNVPHMAMAIAKDQTQADQVADLWNDQNWGDAIAYHSKVRPKHLLPQMMKRIKNNEIKLLVVVDMLKEGFDHPPISIAVILTNIKSSVKFVQFIGRSQRIVRKPVRESPKIRADIVTHCHYEQEDNYQAFKREELIPLQEDNN